ncbi:MAG: hypothetical protein AVDCRST_MAG05-4658, partial [uncultured Rubrobacteraceae bacterium]
WVDNLGRLPRPPPTPAPLSRGGGPKRASSSLCGPPEYRRGS